MSIKKPLLIFALIVISLSLAGSPARKGLFLVTQPDGTTFKASLHGDEFARVMMTEDGCVVRRNNEGFYEYAFMDENGGQSLSGYKAGAANVPFLVLSESRNIKVGALRANASRFRQMKESAFQPLVRTKADVLKKHCLIILAQFADVKFQNPETALKDFNDLINLEGYSKDGATGSVLDYFKAQSLGTYSFTFVVGNVVTLSKTLDYYGRNDILGNDEHPQEIVEEACKLADAEIDFSEFDDDGDGVVDNVFVIVAGKSEAEGGGDNCIWPHQWYVDNALVLDGKKIGSYAMSTELTIRSYDKDRKPIWGQAQIGTFCHEYSHTLGLMDLYDTDYEESEGTGIGMWLSLSLMDGGCYNNSGMTPPNYNAIERECLGIGKKAYMTNGAVTLKPICEEGDYLILENQEDKSDFYLFECRANEGWDKYIGGSGLLIYHVNMTTKPAGYSKGSGGVVSALYRWKNNEINCNPNHECAEVLEPISNAMNVNQAFFPYGNKTSFDKNSEKPFMFADGTECGVALNGIKTNGKNVTFNVIDSRIFLPNVIDLKSEVFQDAAILTWASDLTDAPYTATVQWGETSKTTKTIAVEPYEAGYYGVKLEGLAPRTPYSVTVTIEKNGVIGKEAEHNFLTKNENDKPKTRIVFGTADSGRQSGIFLKNSKLPLVVENAIGDKVEWYFNNARIENGNTGYYVLETSGTLKAVISKSDGSKEIIIKEVSVN